MTHLSVRVGERYGEVWVRHGTQNSHQRLDGVGVHHRSVLFEVFRGEATLVNDPGKKRQKRALVQQRHHSKGKKTRVHTNKRMNVCDAIPEDDPIQWAEDVKNKKIKYLRSLVFGINFKIHKQFAVGALFARTHCVMLI